MRKTVKKLVENRRQALSNAGDSRFSENELLQWCRLLGDVDFDVVERFVVELQYMVDRLGALNERICLLQLDFPGPFKLDKIKAFAASAYQVFEISKQRFILLYVGPMRAPDIAKTVVNKVQETLDQRNPRNHHNQLNIRICEVFSHNIVEPIAVLSELASCPIHKIEEFN